MYPSSSRQGLGRSVFTAFGEYLRRGEAVTSAEWRRAALHAAMRQCLHLNIRKRLTVVLEGCIAVELTLCSLPAARIRFLLRLCGDAAYDCRGQVDGEKASAGCQMRPLSM